MLSKRRLCFVRYEPDPLFTPPDGVPEKILRGLPAGYDLYRQITRIFEGLRALTCALFAGAGGQSQDVESLSFISGIDEELCSSVRGADPEGNRSRRRYILQAFNILALLYTILLSGYEGTSTELFLYRFENVFNDGYEMLGAAVAHIFRSLLTGEALDSDIFVLEMSQLIEVRVPLTWACWQSIKRCLFEFLIENPACRDDLQDLWKQSMGNSGVDSYEINAQK
jgi:hypothetical protein